MTIEQAFEHFRARAAAYGLTEVTEETHPEAFEHRLTTVHRDGGGVRLVWDGKEKHLTLEGTHGPPEGPVWWLDAFDASCPDGHIPASEHECPSFEECVEYAFELMRPDLSPGAV